MSKAYFATDGVLWRNWTKPEGKAIGMSSFTVNTLCERHNSALSDLDTIGGQFGQALRDMWEWATKSTIVRSSVVHDFDGPKLERWFLKCMVDLLIRDGRGLRWANGAQPDTPPVDLVQAVYGQAPINSPKGLWDIHIPRPAFLTNHFGSLLTAGDDGTFCAARFECNGMLVMFWLQEEPPQYDRDAHLIRADTSDMTNSGAQYPDSPDILVARHSPVWYFEVPTKVTFRFHWPDERLLLERPPMA